MKTIIERQAQILNGFAGLAGIGMLWIVSGWVLWRSLLTETGDLTLDFIPSPLLFTLGLGLLSLGGAGTLGFFLVEPNQSKVMLYLGSYVGSVQDPGFYWVVPYLFQARSISLRVRNFSSDRIKVNDAQGSPIEIAAVVVWQVVDSAKALLNVDTFQGFVAIQSEAALRTLANRYSYDSFDIQYKSFRDDPDEISQRLQADVQARLEVAGVKVLEARITYLAYAPEIAQAMLRRQQALAIVAAKERIVEGALGMVEMALNGLSDKGLVQLTEDRKATIWLSISITTNHPCLVQLTEDRKATMVNNLLVSLVAENGTQPIVNTGTISQEL